MLKNTLKLVFVVSFFLFSVLGVNASASEVIGSISLSASIAEFTVSLDERKIYVAHPSEDKISVIDIDTGDVIKTIFLARNSSPHWVELSPDGTEVYVAERLSGYIQVISTESDQIIKSINAGIGYLNRMDLNKDGSRLYVTTARVTAPIMMSVIDLKTYTVLNKISTNNSQDGVVISPDGEIGYLQSVVNNSNPLNIYTTILNLKNRSISGYVQGSALMQISSDGYTGWGRNYGDNTVSKINLSSNSVIEKSIPISGRVAHLLLSEDNLFVTSDSNGKVYILDKDTLETEEVIQLAGLRASDVYLDINNNLLYVAVLDVGRIDIIHIGGSEPLNTPPTFQQVDEKSVAEKSELTFNISASDPENDSVELSAVNLPEGASFNAETGEFFWTPTQRQSGVYDIRFTATDDGELSMSSEMIVKVTVIDVPTTEELIASLKAGIYVSGLSKPIEKSYRAHIDHGDLYEKENLVAYKNQLEVLKKKIESDFKKGAISNLTYQNLTNTIDAIIAHIDLEIIKIDLEEGVPLYTQKVSSYPSVAETSTWSESVYAEGRANRINDCGLTIRQCGCAITSLVMLGRHYGVTEGVDGSDVNPLNINSWLTSVKKGYDAVGNVSWVRGLAYLGKKEDEKYLTHFRIENASTADMYQVRQFVKNTGPALAFSQYPYHWFVLESALDVGYQIKDPFWFNTKTTDDDKNGSPTIRDYNNEIRKAALFEYQETPQPVQEIIEISLNSPAQLLIEDERGNRLGYDASTGAYLQEIKNGFYDPEYAIIDQENPSSNPHYAKQLMLVEPEGEYFTLTVTGTGEGEYSLTSNISDGEGGIHGDTKVDETYVGKVDNYTVQTNPNTEALPLYLNDILQMIPMAEQKKFVQAFKVIFAQSQKDHVAVTETLIENLIRFVEHTYISEVWSTDVQSALRALIID